MDLQLHNKVVLITGGAMGIGAAIVRAAAAEGASVALVDRCAEPARALAAGLPGVHAIVTDLIDPENCRSAVEQALARFGRIDAVVNNAGINDRVGLEHGSPARYVESLQRNLFHYYNVVHFALTALKETQGAIVNIASKT